VVGLPWWKSANEHVSVETMQPYRGEKTPKVTTHADVPAKRRMWAVLLVAPLVLAFAFTDLTTRTLRPTYGNAPTSLEGFEPPPDPYDYRVNRNMVVLRLVTVMVAVYGVFLFAKRPPSTHVIIERDPHL
jgi:hypothetical protein